jgi:hypothetical protein
MWTMIQEKAGRSPSSAQACHALSRVSLVLRPMVVDVCDATLQTSRA